MLATPLPLPLLWMTVGVYTRADTTRGSRDTDAGIGTGRAAGMPGTVVMRGVGGAGIRGGRMTMTLLLTMRIEGAVDPALPAGARGGPVIRVLRSPARTAEVARDAAALAPRDRGVGAQLSRASFGSVSWGRW